MNKAYYACFLIFHLSTLGADWPPEGNPVRVEVTRDVDITSFSFERGRDDNQRNGNSGGSAELKTKSCEEMVILDFNPKNILGHVITGAELHFQKTGGWPQRRLTVSTLATDWVEGTSTNYLEQEGSSSFLWAAQKKIPWTPVGEDITAVTCGMGNTLWRFAESSPPNSNGWQMVPIEPAVVAARIAGISHGFVLYDDVGSEYEINGTNLVFHELPNRYLKSRESGLDSAPFFKIFLGEEDHEPPQTIGKISYQTDGLPAGEAKVSWTSPEDMGKAGVSGFLACFSHDQSHKWGNSTPIPQYLVPMASPPGTSVVMHLRNLAFKPGESITLGLRPVDGAGNIGEPAWRQITASNGFPALKLKSSVPPLFSDRGTRAKLGDAEVAIIDTLDKIHPVTGVLIPQKPESYFRANHLWSAADKLIRLSAAKNEFVDFQIVLSGPLKAVSAEIKFKEEGSGTPQSDFFRFRHVQTEKGPLPDPLIPLGGPFNIPSPDENIEGQKHASMVVDVYVPHEATPGLKRGILTLKAENQILSLNVELNVWDFTLPDYLSFIPEMNCYSLNPSELEYYRLAHAHRTCLNMVPYSQNGKLKGKVPEQKGVFLSWEAFDHAYGPLLDGSAFKDLPRKNVPLDTFYLPLNESWPAKLKDHMIKSYWADEAISQQYRKKFVEMCKQFALHCGEREWNDTLFEFFLNNKVTNDTKGTDPGDTPWLFDEPKNTQDYWALRWYGNAFHEGVTSNCKNAKLVFRCDISRPEFQRELLDGILDVNVVSYSLTHYLQRIMDRKRLNGELSFNYGNSNRLEYSNVQPAIWCIDSWCKGLDGVIPWKTTGEKEAWIKGQREAIFYPPRNKREKAPFPSVRLKAYRRGQQEVEYLVLLTQALNQPRETVATYIREFLQLKDEKDFEEIKRTDYSKIDAVTLWRLHMFVGSLVDQQKPKPQRKLVDFKTPPRTPKDQDFYVTVAPPKDKPKEK